MAKLGVDISDERLRIDRRFSAEFRLITVALVAVFSTVAFADSRFECSAIQSKLLKRPVPYCVMLPPSFDAQKTSKFPVLYYLHGLGDNEQSLVNGGGWELYEQLQREKKIGEFLIVTPAGFRSFYVNSRDGTVPYEDFFFQEFMPAIERHYRGIGTRQSRAVMGVSMGGFGALRYAFSRPSVFASVSAHMPALSDSVPTSMSSGPEQHMLQNIFGVPQDHTIDEGYYRRVSPLSLAASVSTGQLRRLNIYFDCGTNDDYGFDLGSEMLHKTLQRRGIPHEFHIYPGGHNWSYAMQHFGASLVFHSKALNAQIPSSAAKK